MADRFLLSLATYNEVTNLPRLVQELRSLYPNLDILVIDDASPDGTGVWCTEYARSDQRFEVRHRPGKLGLGSANLVAIAHAIQCRYDWLATMDADFSHDPQALRALLDRATASPSCDVVIGSRYVAGGEIQDWPLYRRISSRLVNGFARWMLGIPASDCSSGFRCYRVNALAKLDLLTCDTMGYDFYERILWLLIRHDARITEVPITFADRQSGSSKVTAAESLRSAASLLRLCIKP